MNIEKYFPFEKVRDSQRDAIEHAIKSFEDGKKYVIIEAGTGIGKSAIGVTLARWIHDTFPESMDSSFKEGAYFLTTQKILQQQYIEDFGSRMRQLMSSSNYTCKFDKKMTCAEGLAKLKSSNDKSSRQYKCCSFGCNYKEAKRTFISSTESITNFSYFLTETSYIGKLEPRSLLIVDEAHNIDTEMTKFIEISVSERFAKSVLKLEMPDIRTDKQAWKWIINEYFPRLNSHVDHIVLTLEKFNLTEKVMANFVKLAKQLEVLEKHQAKIKKFIEIYNEENWVVNIVDADGQSMRKLEFKPIDVSSYTNQFLFDKGKRVVMMSATILNKDGFCQTLGIKEEDCSFISIPSPFPPENHPIFAYPIAKMSASSIDQGLPKIADAIKAILAQHPNEKGVIHSHSYKIVNYLRKNVKSSRLIFHDSNNRQEMLEKHISSSKPTVLVSPSMQEGVDLKDDLSRFQIICKIPYPYLGDKIIKKRMYRWPWWYSLQTAKTIVQSLGRSVRNHDDKAVSYILDADWDRFYSKNSQLFPENFKQSLKS
jgi:Rad3-related DNA helicase